MSPKLGREIDSLPNNEAADSGSLVLPLGAPCSGAAPGTEQARDDARRRPLSRSGTLSSGTTSATARSSRGRSASPVLRDSSRRRHQIDGPIGFRSQRQSKRPRPAFRAHSETAEIPGGQRTECARWRSGRGHVQRRGHVARAPTGPPRIAQRSSRAEVGAGSRRAARGSGATESHVRADDNDYAIHSGENGGIATRGSGDWMSLRCRSPNCTRVMGAGRCGISTRRWREATGFDIVPFSSS